LWGLLNFVNYLLRSSTGKYSNSSGTAEILRSAGILNDYWNGYLLTTSYKEGSSIFFAGLVYKEELTGLGYSIFNESWKFDGINNVNDPWYKLCM
jgi:hypothetical protein